MRKFLDRLLLRSQLSDQEADAILAIPFAEITVAKGRELRRFGEIRRFASIICSGTVARYSQGRDGNRQFAALHLVGDMADLCSVMLPDPGFGLVALNATNIFSVRHDHLFAISQKYPGVMEAFWRDCVADSCLIAQQVVRIATLEADARLANLICELAVRYGDGEHNPCLNFELGLTQESLGEAVGFTAVHINRMVRLLREAGLATIGQTVAITDWRGLARVGEFSADYLHLPESRTPVLRQIAVE